MGQIKMDSAERGVMELKRHLLESEVKLSKPTLEQLIMYGVLTREKAQEIYEVPDGELRMTYFLNYLEDSGKPGTIKALARSLTRDYILVAESLMFEINLAEGLYADEQQLLEAHEQAGRDIHREYNSSRRISEGDKLVLQQIIAERFLYAQRVYGRQLLKTKGAVSHQQMIGEDLDRAAKKLNIQAIQATDELRHKFVSLLGTVVQGGSMISEHDNRCISELFYSPGGILKNNTPIEDLDRQFQEITRITGRCLMEMDYLKDEKKRILENLGFDVKANKDVGIDVVIGEIMDRYDTKIKERLDKAEDRDQDRRATQMEIGNSELDASKKMEEMDKQISQLEQELKDVAPEVAVEIENVERFRRQLRKESEELEMWKQTCDHLENGTRLNKIYEKALQKLMTESDRETWKECFPESSALPRVILKRYDNLLSDGKELLRATDRVLDNEYGNLVEEEFESEKGEIEEEKPAHENKEKSGQGVSPTSSRPPSRARPPTRANPPMTPVQESKLESRSISTMKSVSARSSMSNFIRADDMSRAEKRENRDRPWARSLQAETSPERKPRRDNISKSLDRPWSRASSKGKGDNTWESGREILIGDQPWGHSIRREKTWCAPDRDRNKQSMTREEKRLNRERPWVLSKKKKAILRQSTSYDLPMPRTETSLGDNPKTRAKSEMKVNDRLMSRVEIRPDHPVPQISEFSPRESQSRIAGREVSFSLDENRRYASDANKNQAARSLDTPLTYYNLSLDESLGHNNTDTKESPDIAIGSVSPLPLGDSTRLGGMSPNSQRDAWLHTPKNKPTEKEVSFYKSPDLAVSEGEASSKPHNQFIPKKKVIRRQRSRTLSKDEKPLDRFGGTMTSWSSDPFGPRPHTRAEGLEGPTVWQIKAPEIRPHTRGNPLETSARENNTSRKHYIN